MQRSQAQAGVLRQRLSDDASVAVHCRHAIGRWSTLAVPALALEGVEPTDAWGPDRCRAGHASTRHRRLARIHRQARTHWLTRKFQQGAQRQSRALAGHRGGTDQPFRRTKSGEAASRARHAERCQSPPRSPRRPSSCRCSPRRHASVRPGPAPGSPRHRRAPHPGSAERAISGWGWSTSIWLRLTAFSPSSWPCGLCVSWP
jgi:hypothetical protein